MYSCRYVGAIANPNLWIWIWIYFYAAGKVIIFFCCGWDVLASGNDRACPLLSVMKFLMMAPWWKWLRNRSAIKIGGYPGTYPDVGTVTWPLSVGTREHWKMLVIWILLSKNPTMETIFQWRTPEAIDSFIFSTTPYGYDWRLYAKMFINGLKDLWFLVYKHKLPQLVN